MGLTGDSLSVFCLLAGVAVTVGFGARMESSRGVRKVLWIVTGVLAVSAVGVALTAWRINWGALLPFGYALIPPFTVAMVAVMLRGRTRTQIPIALSLVEVAALVDKKLADLPAPLGPQAQELPLAPSQASLWAALEAVAAPLVAKAKLDRLRSIKMPKMEKPQHYIPDDPRLPAESLYHLRSELAGVECSLEEDGEPGLQQRLQTAEARIMGDAKYITQTPDDPVVWPTPETKRLWHLLSARSKLLHDELSRQTRLREGQAYLDPNHLEMTLKNLREQA